MSELLKLVSGSLWIQPFVILIFFIWIEERVRNAKMMDKVESIKQLKVRHNKTASQGTKCVTTLSNIIEESQNDEILKLYYIDFPEVSKCLSSLQVRRFALYIALAVILFLLQYLLSHLSDKMIPKEDVEQIKGWSSGIGLLLCFGFGLFFWFKRYLPIRTFCDQIVKLKGE